MKNKKPKIVQKPIQRKTFWVPKPRKSEIVLCACGNKYIKTRPGQTTCVRCINIVSVAGH